MFKGKQVVFDIETDGLVGTKIHVVSRHEYKSEVRGMTSTGDYKEIIEYFNSLTEDDIIVGHNIKLFDVPEMKRLLGSELNIKAKLIDTLPLSWALYPKRLKHGLESWTHDLGTHKPYIDDWENLSYEEYKDRSENDVKTNVLLWHKILGDLNTLYDGDEKEILRYIDYLMFNVETYCIMKENKLKLDVPFCMNNLDELECLAEEKVSMVNSMMPPTPVYGWRTKPAQMLKKDGSFTSRGLDWLELLDELDLPQDYSNKIKVIKKYKQPSCNSHTQVKKWLYDLGWKPQTYKFTRDKDTGEVKQVEQIRVDKDGEKVLCDSVLKLKDKAPAIEHLEGLSVINHRIGLLKGFLRDMDEDGNIYADIGGTTSTLRIKHRKLVNMPGVKKPYGNYIRGCLTAQDGLEICGSDISSLENNTKLHYLKPIDPEFVERQLDKEYDPHLSLALSGGLVSQEEVAFYKEYKALSQEDKDSQPKDVKDKFNDIDAKRFISKQINYSITYGAGVKTLARNCGITEELATRLKNAYTKENWAQYRFAKQLKTKEALGVKWVFNPVSKFWYELRSEKDRFSAINQSTGAYIFLLWLEEMLKHDIKLSAGFHDEVVLQTNPAQRTYIKNLLEESMDAVNKRLGLNVPLRVDVNFGKSYSDVH